LPSSPRALRRRNSKRSSRPRIAKASDREVDLAALVVAQLQELVNAVAERLPTT
jgi:hypothetical protein